MSASPQENVSEVKLGDRMANLLTGMVRSLVDEPDTVRVEKDEAAGSTTLRLYVASEDLGKVIGKQGRTARSLRTILNAIGSKAQHRIQLDVLEDGAASLN